MGAETSVEPASGSSERRPLPRAGAAWEARVSLAQAVPSPTGPSLKEPEHEWAEMVKESVNSPIPGRWHSGSRGQPGSLIRNRWRQGRM